MSGPTSAIDVSSRSNASRVSLIAAGRIRLWSALSWSASGDWPATWASTLFASAQFFCAMSARASATPTRGSAGYFARSAVSAASPPVDAVVSSSSDAVLPAGGGVAEVGALASPDASADGAIPAAGTSLLPWSASTTTISTRPISPAPAEIASTNGGVGFFDPPAGAVAPALAATMVLPTTSTFDGMGLRPDAMALGIAAETGPYGASGGDATSSAASVAFASA